MNKLDKAKEIIAEHFEDGNCGLYNTRNWVGDPMHTIYVDNGLQIDICYGCCYFEVFGLTNDEFSELKCFYDNLEAEAEEEEEI